MTDETKTPQEQTTAGSACSAGLGESLTPVERLAMEMEQTNHQDEANALLLLDCVFRHMLRDGGPYTEDGQKFSDMLLEALESWLPEDLKIVDA